MRNLLERRMSIIPHTDKLPLVVPALYARFVLLFCSGTTCTYVQWGRRSAPVSPAWVAWLPNTNRCAGFHPHERRLSGLFSQMISFGSPSGLLCMSMISVAGWNALFELHSYRCNMHICLYVCNRSTSEKVP